MDLLLELVVIGVVVGSIYALLAVGFALIFVTTRLFHFAHGAVYAVAAYTIFFAKQSLGWDILPGMLLALVVAVLVGVGIELGVYRPLRRLGATPLTILIASLGVMIFLQNLLALAFGSDIKNIGAGFPTDIYHVGSLSLTSLQIATVIAAIALFVLLQLYLKFTRTGKAIRAVANNAELSNIIGIGSDRVFILVFAIGSALAAPAALLVSLHTGITPTMGTMAIMVGAVAVIVGGVGSVPGAALGALLIGVAENVGVWRIPSEWQPAIAFGILLVFIIFRPTGFFGQKIRQSEV